VKVYDGADDAWEATGFTSHADLTDVTRSAHHPPVDVSGPLTQPSDQSLGLSIGDGLLDSNGTLVADLGNGLGIDSNGQVYVPASAVSQSMLAFDTATQGELDTHAGDTTNPHNVTDDQTGAASALSDHESDTTNPHNVTDDQTGAASALSNHESDSNPHGVSLSESGPSSIDLGNGNWHQNTRGNPIVVVGGSGDYYFHINSSASDNIVAQGGGGDKHGWSFIVPDNYYYKITDRNGYSASVQYSYRMDLYVG